MRYPSSTLTLLLGILSIHSSFITARSLPLPLPLPLPSSTRNHDRVFDIDRDPVGSILPLIQDGSLVHDGPDWNLRVAANNGEIGDQGRISESRLIDGNHDNGGGGVGVGVGVGVDPVKGGWLSRWLSMGGEGVVTITFSGTNFTLPHRPAAFPTHLPTLTSLPLSGFLKPFQSLPSPPSSSSTSTTSTTTTNPTTKHDPSLACYSPAFPPIRYTPPSKPYTFALVERGGCDFATKVRSAQERGAAGVVVGDTVLRVGETDMEGRTRESLITMFSPEDTESIFIPSVFVSRASFLVLRDLLANQTDSGRPEGHGLWVELGQGVDEGGALSSMLSFALLMPSLFLLATIAVHRIRVARQREADRAPPQVVLSLPERIWTPDIVWEKDDSDSDSSSSNSPSPTKSDTTKAVFSQNDSGSGHVQAEPTSPTTPIQSTSHLSPCLPAGIPLEPETALVSTETSTGGDGHGNGNGNRTLPITTKIKKKKRTKSSNTVKRHYYSKDECAICMDSFEKGDVVRILPCGHVFHKDECDEWLIKWRKLCPTCRADVTLLNTIPPSTILTPVTDPSDPQAPLHPSIIAQLSGLIPRRSWFRLNRRPTIRLDEEAGERTPLVVTTTAITTTTTATASQLAPARDE